MTDTEREKLIKGMFDHLDRDESNTLSKEELENFLKQMSDTLDIHLLADRILLHFDLRDHDLSWEEFHSWMKNEFNVASARGFSENLTECLKIPAFEVVLTLEDLKSRASASDCEKLEWCIKQILPLTADRFQPQILPMKNSFLAKEAFSHIDEYSSLPLIRLALSDEEKSRKSINQRLTITSPSEIDLNIYLPAADFDISDFDLEIFSLSEEYGSVTLLNIYAYKAFTHWDLFNSLGFDMQTFLRYCTFIGEGYKDNQYHNVLHAADVMQACHVFLLTSTLHDTAEMNALHIAALLLAAIVHDYKHPGVNNAYLFITGAKLAIRYNDSSILENYHVAKAFEISQRESSNIFAGTSKEEYRSIRKLMISAVLGTDMSKHSKHIGEVQTKLGRTEELKDDKEFIVGTLLHLADLSNPCRKKDLSEQWSLKITEEFFLQGDRERENDIEVSPICDRTKVNVAKNQVGFMTGVIVPYVAPICRNIPQLKFLQDNLGKNIDYWAGRIEEFEQKLNSLQDH